MRSLLLALCLTACDRPLLSPLDGVVPIGIGPPVGTVADLGAVGTPPVGASDGGSPADPETGSGESSSPTWTLYGEVRQLAACPAGAHGPIRVALTQRCGDWSHPTAVQSGPAYDFAVADGVYYLSAFLDCDHSGLSAPSTGDLVAIFHAQPCRTYHLKGQGVLDLPIELTSP